jgi:hypothetical protein
MSKALHNAEITQETGMFTQVTSGCITKFFFKSGQSINTNA